MKESRIRRIDPILAILVILAAGLSLYHINQSGALNSYYIAAITSMVQSWHNFFFNAYDPGGFITIDKPPVAFWLQAISAKIFGIHSWSLALPSALGLAGSVILLYLIIKPHFGIAAARIAALILAVTPIAVAVSRTNNADSTLVFFLMLATYFLFKSIRSGKLITLCIAFGLVGVGFNTKMLQAFMILPAFYLFYGLARKGQWKQKILHLLTASVLLGVISLSWAVIVDVTPAYQRPYVGSSGTSNSVLELALGYNGINRLTGDSGGGSAGNMPSSAPAHRTSSSNTSAVNSEDGSSTAKALADTSQSIEATTPSNQATQTTTSNTASALTNTRSGNAPPQGGLGGSMDNGNGRAGGGSMGGSGGSNDAGNAGVFRLFSTANAGQIAWFLPLAILSALLLWIQRREQRPMILFWVAWLAPMILFFSIAGHIHRYYFIMMAPAIAALTGAAIAYLWQNIHKRWLTIFMLVGIATGLYITISLDQMILGIVTAVIGVIAWMIAVRAHYKTSMLSLPLTLVALLLAPAYWSITPAMYGGNSTQPYAGPELATSSGRSNSSSIDEGLITYLQQHYTGEKYLVATSSSQTATPIILATGLPVIAWGGFKGSDTALTPTQLEALITDGELKYVVLGGGMGGGSSDLTSWVQEHGTAIAQTEWSATTTSTATTSSHSQRGGGRSSQLTLYELHPS